MKKWAVVVVTGTVVTSTACGALFNSGPQPVTFTSNPPGAAVWVDNVPRGQTPVILSLPKNENHSILFKMDGYQEFGATINKKVSAGYVVLDILGGLFPVIIDAATGSWYKLDANTIHGPLAKIGGTSVEPAAASGTLTQAQIKMLKEGKRLDDILGFQLVRDR
jgi:hypothetical protein